jgi:hypothetical protein
VGSLRGPVGLKCLSISVELLFRLSQFNLGDVSARPHTATHKSARLGPASAPLRARGLFKAAHQALIRHNAGSSGTTSGSAACLRRRLEPILVKLIHVGAGDRRRPQALWSSGKTGVSPAPIESQRARPHDKACAVRRLQGHEDRNLQPQWRQWPASRSSAPAPGNVARCVMSPSRRRYVVSALSPHRRLLLPSSRKTFLIGPGLGRNAKESSDTARCAKDPARRKR